MPMFKRGCALLLLALAASVRGSTGVPMAGQANPPVQRVALSPDKLEWRKSTDSTDPKEGVVLFGDQSKPELFGLLVKWPPNTTAKAHSHPENRHVMVVSGTFYYAHGNKFDESKLQRLPSGSYFTEPSGDAHFGATKDDGAILYFVGVGPGGMTQVER
jgi:quercetin dioxygenase-like cupin family protein